MVDLISSNQIPGLYPEILRKTEEIGFSMASDIHMCSLLRTLVASKPAGRFLELGTGTGLALSWIADGIDQQSRLISIDNDPEIMTIAENFFQQDDRVELLCTDGSAWLRSYHGSPYDLVFADAWPGKYSELDEVLNLLKPGGIYIIDDMLPQPNWPEGHAEKVKKLVADLEKREELIITSLNWSTGIVMAVKRDRP